MYSRRAFLQTTAGLSFVSLAGVVHPLLARAAEASADADRNDHVLVVVELAGGNDGLNTVIPFENPLYYKNRPTLGIAKGDVVKLSDQLGLHPRMAALGELFRDGRVAVVQGVGYPEPDRSHFRSMEIWHTASTQKRPPTAGWLGRLLDTTVGDNESQFAGLSLTGSLPQALRADKVVVPVVEKLQSIAQGGDAASPQDALVRKLATAPRAAAGPVDFMRRQAETVYRAAERLKDAASRYRSSTAYPDTPLAGQLRQAAEIINADLGMRVLFASQDGYDTHAEQGDMHGELLGQLSEALSAFDRDLTELKKADRVVVLVFSEFGRRVDENASRGTDHGAASSLFVVGSPVKGGLLGKYPSLEELGDGDLIFNTDFRSVYTTLLDGWLGCPAPQVLRDEFAKLELLRV
ncbi:MAG TPA: DUF1501 domain-containing protein [Pirellulales bacterium]|jgi:uncharacterized protein (DUF1501 family)|nr:DUF1501 domain-containing protein [Pirellulales bacterium]